MSKFDLSDWLLVIPARLDSTRLPLKMTQDLCGKPLVVRVYENLASLVKYGLSLVVATDSEEIKFICSFYQIPSVLTSSSHKSGTDRCYEAAQIFEKPYVLNVQGDEPFLNQEDLMTLFQKEDLLREGEILTLAKKNSDQMDLNSDSVVKLIPDGSLVSSFCRSLEDWKEKFFWQHLGVYAYHFDTLKIFCSLAQDEKEKSLRLEQMRALANGIKIRFFEAQKASLGIDTKEDLIKAREIFSSRERLMK